MHSYIYIAHTHINTHACTGHIYCCIYTLHVRICIQRKSDLYALYAIIRPCGSHPAGLFRRVLLSEARVVLRERDCSFFAQGGERKPGHIRIPVNSQDEEGLAAIHWAAMRGLVPVPSSAARVAASCPGPVVWALCHHMRALMASGQYTCRRVPLQALGCFHCKV